MRLLSGVFAVLFSQALLVAGAPPVTPTQQSQSPAIHEQALIYGASRKGRPLTAYVLGSGPDITLVLGGMHGNELITPLVVERLRAFLKENPSSLDGCTVLLVPRVNPDGDASHTRATSDGVDLNRNFPYGWKPRRTGIKLSPGRGPLSEPEARALVKLLDRFHPIKVVDIHQPLNALVGVGPGGQALAKAMRPENHFRFTTNVGYPTPGSFGSYLSHVRHIACVTLELPRESVDSAWKSNEQALLTAIHYQSR